jgi:4-amino-4-deoxy-L-arabinose transferase-like glycosyltransferase
MAPSITSSITPGLPPKVLWGGLLVGLLLRLGILASTSALPLQIFDERDYHQLAVNLLQGHGFTFDGTTPTSSRPPLYPAFMAGLWWLIGGPSLQAVRAAQIAVGLALAGLACALTRPLFGRRASELALLGTWLYPSFVFFTSLLLTELVFTTLLLLSLWLLLQLLRHGRVATALGAGLALGLGALARSVLWPLPLLLAPLLLLMLKGSWTRRLALVAMLVAGYAAVVAPWALRNYRVQHVLVVVDVLGGYNMRMGNYEHTLEDRMWDTVALTGEKNWSYELTQEFPGRRFTDGEKEKWAQKKALQYMLAHPGVAIRRSLIRFADFWGLEREFIAGLQQGLFRPPAWFALIAAAAVLVSYPLVVAGACLGLWLARSQPDIRLHIVVLLPVLFICGIHTIVFGHSRYHLPLVPIAMVYAAAAIDQKVWTRIRPLTARSMGALATFGLFAAIWARQVIVVDAKRLLSLFGAD